ncbi:DUF721 domain-containing protein [Pelagibacteraceae bacterium]|nr:DUF721 domain-containing protein [Pelagibacteraceae bacterium]
MKNKKIETNRTYVPKKIGETIIKVNKKYSSKFGKNEFLIISKWPQIVGTFFSDHSEPDKITRVTEEFNEFDEPIYKNFLHVKVSPAAAIEFQHYKDTIIEKINSFFGYKAIVDLRLNQNFIPKNNDQNNNKLNQKTISKEEKEAIKNEIGIIHDKELEKSIVNLGASIKKESN